MSLENELNKTLPNINNVYIYYLHNVQPLSTTLSSKLVTFITQQIKKHFTNIEQLERELTQELQKQIHEEWKVAAGGPPPPPPPPGGMGVQNEDKKELLYLILKIRETHYNIYKKIIVEYKETNFTNKYLKYKQKYLELKKIFKV